MPDPDKVATLARACLQRNTEAMSRILSDLTGLDAPFVVRLLADSGGEPLSVCLKAAGIDTGIATRVILFPASKTRAITLTSSASSISSRWYRFARRYCWWTGGVVSARRPGGHRPMFRRFRPALRSARRRLEVAAAKSRLRCHKLDVIAPEEQALYCTHILGQPHESQASPSKLSFRPGRLGMSRDNLPAKPGKGGDSTGFASLSAFD